MVEDVNRPAGRVSATRSRLVSFLGTGKYLPFRHRYYDPATAKHIDGEVTPYVCRALAGFLHADEIEVLATKEAKDEHGAGLERALRAANLPAPSFHPFPLGESNAELWEQFGIVKERLRAPPGTEVALDVTHGFRSQPFFAGAVTAFVRAVDPAPPPIRVFYGARDRETEGLMPVWELTPFIDLLDWAQGMMLFLRAGRARDVARPTMQLARELGRRRAASREAPQPNLGRLGKALQNFGANLETLRTGDLLLGPLGSAAQLATALEEAKEAAAAAPPLADVLDRIRRDMVEPLLGATDHLASEAGHRALAGLARLYLEMGRWPEAAAVVREGWITRHATPAGAFGERNQARPCVDERARRDAEGRWTSEERDAVLRIAAVRNDIEHAGFKTQPQAAEVLQSRLQQLVSEFAAVRPAAEPPRAAGHAPLFINLSNHPSRDWSEAQRAAARALAPEILDRRFPEVPPEADTAEIAARADELVGQLIQEHPGVTHAMVQGEFTLAHMLVRRLQRRGIVCLAATTRREVLEDCGAVKTTRFEFVRFREYG
jgi:CRISPR-associated protein Csx16